MAEGFPSRKRRLHLERHCAQNQTTKSCASPPAPPTHQEGQLPVTGAQQGDVPLLTSDASRAELEPRVLHHRTKTAVGQAALTVPATLLLGPLLDRIRELQPAGAEVPLAATTQSDCSSNPTPASLPRLSYHLRLITRSHPSTGSVTGPGRPPGLTLGTWCSYAVLRPTHVWQTRAHPALHLRARPRGRESAASPFRRWEGRARDAQASGSPHHRGADPCSRPLAAHPGTRKDEHPSRVFVSRWERRLQGPRVGVGGEALRAPPLLARSVTWPAAPAAPAGRSRDSRAVALAAAAAGRRGGGAAGGGGAWGTPRDWPKEGGGCSRRPGRATWPPGHASAASRAPEPELGREGRAKIGECSLRDLRPGGGGGSRNCTRRPQLPPEQAYGTTVRLGPQARGIPERGAAPPG
uniref:Uncharacterized protein n=1 Tax=Rangifer tarandus platyrhynchus TaxID=3082113 RepID=A0ACB0F9W9_RANTA|nr:unnamed protein product [Rangifer tarandus platyrhynchus]